MSEEINGERLAAIWTKMRDAKAVINQEAEAKIKKIEDQQRMVEGMMLELLRKTGGTALKTSHGTIYRQESVLPIGSDWGAFYDWVKENDAFEFLEKRIKRGEVEKYLEKNGGTPPPGVSVQRKFVAKVLAR